jgi:hypothetical protein
MSRCEDLLSRGIAPGDDATHASASARHEARHAGIGRHGRDRQAAVQMASPADFHRQQMAVIGRGRRPLHRNIYRTYRL